MGSTGEPDRKRRHFSSISPTAATAKKPTFAPLSEEKKLDAAVLQFQNQKLSQKLDAQKVEIVALENKLGQLKEKQQPYDGTLGRISTSWEELVNELESCSLRTKDLVRRRHAVKDLFTREGGVLSSPEDSFLSRLFETGATESCSASETSYQMEDDKLASDEKNKNILSNVVAAIDELWRIKDQLYDAISEALPEAGRTSGGLQTEVKNLRLAVGELHLKHKSLAGELQIQLDTDAKNKAELKHLRGELEKTVAELEDSNRKLAILKVERDMAKGASFPILNVGNKQVAGDKARDKQKDLHDLESMLKELLDQSANRLLELKQLHEERIDILKQLSTLQNNLKNVRSICSTRAYVLIKDQLEKAKADLLQYQLLYKKLQTEKDNLVWREKEMNVKNDVIDVLRRSCAVADTRITELGMRIEKQLNERKLIETKIEESSREPGRKEIIAQFRSLVSSFPDEMGSMQSQLSKYKETASDIHSLRAEVQSFSNILARKAKEMELLTNQSADHVTEMQTLQAVVNDLKESDMELKLVLEMYRRESTSSRDLIEARDSELKAWAHVQSLKTSLDEHNLEVRVKTAIEAEAKSQQKLAAAEAEIAELRQKLEASKRERSRLSEVLKSKHEETEAYLSEIETIGQAYDDMQTQNQQLLQQITERDDYNIKLVLEGVRARQTQDALVMEKQTMERAVQEVNAAVDLYGMKAARIEDQLKMCSDQVQKLAEDRIQSAVTLENTQNRLTDVRKSSQQLRQSLEESQSNVDRSRMHLAELQIKLEKERFERKRIEEDIEATRRKASRLRSQIEGSSAVEKLQQELREYKEILKCSICLDRGKEVVITKCYHLFCNPCVQSIIESRHRKCPVCMASFGPNDVKPVYI